MFELEDLSAGLSEKPSWSFVPLVVHDFAPCDYKNRRTAQKSRA